MRKLRFTNTVTQTVSVLTLRLRVARSKHGSNVEHVVIVLHGKRLVQVSAGRAARAGCGGTHTYAEAP